MVTASKSGIGSTNTVASGDVKLLKYLAIGDTIQIKTISGTTTVRGTFVLISGESLFSLTYLRS